MVSDKLRVLSECTFLKRGFVKNCRVSGNERHWNSPLELETIIDAIRWYRTNNDGEDVALNEWASNVKSMMEELSQHTQETYVTVGSQIIQAANALKKKPMGLPITLPPQVDLQAVVLERDLEY